MGAMDYISSANLCYLVCDTLRLMDKRPVDHGMRIAYMLMKLLQGKGGYDEYEAAELVFLGMIHDIGAYKTNKFDDMFRYDMQEAGRAHAVYGSLFLKNVSPFGERSDIVRYHHLPYDKLKEIDYKYIRIAAYISLLEDVDRLYRRDGVEMDCDVLKSKMGERYFPEAVALFLSCVNDENMLGLLASGEYEKELRMFMGNVLFTNEEKDSYVGFVMHCFSLRGRMRTMEAILCRCIAEEIAESMRLTSREREVLKYAAMLRNIGMLAVDKSVLHVTEELTDAEIAAIREHVVIGTELLEKYFLTREITDVIAAHHELIDGGGYPAGLHNQDLTDLQCILQAADCVTVMMNEKTKGQMLGKDEILRIVTKHVDRNRLRKKAAQGIFNRYDRIEERTQAEVRAFLEMHIRINNDYKALLERGQGK